MESFNIKSKSKLNLFLEVGALRNDGYHEIHTIMVKTDLGDYINITLEKSNLAVPVGTQLPLLFC